MVPSITELEQGLVVLLGKTRQRNRLHLTLQDLEVNAYDNGEGIKRSIPKCLVPLSKKGKLMQTSHCPKS